MAFHFSPNIVTDGLLLHVDAANPKSYISGSLIWNNLINQNLSGSLINGPIFETRSIVFDGVNDYIEFSSSNDFDFCNSTNDLPFSISTWFYSKKFDGSPLVNRGDNGNGTFESYSFSLTSGSVQMTLYDTSGVNWIFKKTTGSLLLTGSWKNICMTYSGGLYNGINIYIDSQLQSFITGSNGSYLKMRSQSNSVLFLGSFGSNGSFHDKAKGNIAVTSIYGKALSEEEIKQNYNAMKKRFI